MVVIDTAGHWLNDSAGASLGRAVAAGCPLSITSAGRTVAEQTALRNAYLADPIHVSYAAPLTGGNASEHLAGNAIDAAEPMRTWLHTHGAEYGWVFTGGANEPWHFAYRASSDGHLIPTALAGNPPAPIEEAPMARLVQVAQTGTYILVDPLTYETIDPDDVAAALVITGQSAPAPVTAADATRMGNVVSANRKQLFYGQVDTAALAAAVVATLPAPGGGGLTADEVTAAVQTALSSLTLKAQ